MKTKRAILTPLPSDLVAAARRLAKQQRSTAADVLRAALQQYETDVKTRDVLWRRTRKRGSAAARRLGLRSDADVQALLYEIRHGRPQPEPLHAAARRR